MYITAQDLVDKFGSAWASADDFDVYSELVNAWLFGKNIPLESQVSSESWAVIKQAAFFLARAAKEDALYTNDDGIKSESVSADTGVSVETSYFAYQKVLNRWIKAAMDLLDPWLSSTSLVFSIDKIN